MFQVEALRNYVQRWPADHVSPLIEWITSRVDVAIEKHGLIREELTRKELMRDPNLTGLTDPIDVAKQLGTYEKIDRTPQYTNSEQEQPSKLLKAVNAQGNHIRGLQVDTGRIQQQVFNLKLRNAIVVAVVTGALARAPEIWAWLARIF
jgi:hypothetical protein